MTAGRLRDALVLVTGASSGIGRAAAIEFARRGARVIGLARSVERLKTLADELGGPPRFTALPADVADAASMELATTRILAELGLPDVVVANAGIGLDALVWHTSDEELHHVLEVNVVGVVRTIRPFLPGMLERRSGRIVLVSSIVGKRGIPHYGAYSASKFALHGLADALRAEISGSGVSVGVVCPASTETEFQTRRLRRGPPQRHKRPRSHGADTVARAVVEMAASRRREIVLSPEARLLVLASALFPGLVDRLLARALRARTD